MALLKIKYPEAYQAWVKYLTDNRIKKNSKRLGQRYIVIHRHGLI